MSTHQLPAPWADVTVTLPHDITYEKLMAYTPFTNWLKTLSKSLALQNSQGDDSPHPFGENPYTLKSIIVNSVTYFGKRIGFLKFKADISNSKGEKLDGTVFMRGGSVAVLMIIRPKGHDEERLVVMTQQPRVPAGSLTFFEIPAGMIDESGTFTGAAAKEIMEETNLFMLEEDLINMTAKALANAKTSESHLEKAMYPSPGGSDEFIPLFLWERTMERQNINAIRDSLAGVDNEKITVKLVDYNELWKEGARDAKTLAALALYEGLSREGTLYDPM